MTNYTTVQGDTWDGIAYKIWGSEYLFPLLLDVNTKHRDTVIFSADVNLNVPTIDEAVYTERPPWLEDGDLA